MTSVVLVGCDRAHEISTNISTSIANMVVGIRRVRIFQCNGRIHPNVFVAPATSSLHADHVVVVFCLLSLMLLSSDQLYDPERLRVNLLAIETQDRTLEQVEEEVRTVCAEEGIFLSVTKYSRLRNRSCHDMRKSSCQRGGTNRLADYLRRLDNGKRVSSPTSTVQCKRWRHVCKVANRLIRLHIPYFRAIHAPPPFNILSSYCCLCI